MDLYQKSGGFTGSKLSPAAYNSYSPVVGVVSNNKQYFAPLGLFFWGLS